METQTTESIAPATDEKELLKQEILSNLIRNQAHYPESATSGDWWRAICLTVRSRMLEQACAVGKAHAEQNVRRVYYLSLEYLMGRLLENNLVNLGLLESCREAITELGQDFDELVESGPDLGLGNGGLGRLAACCLDALATLALPA
ncbi:MAG: glycogen/starch/alpha-glucan phosphorylase, partial [Verrucomicrobiales bacterium]|nr:glycogen/starch/alpha-glucan phosphorylase [Verrucomicrobiales bacterium]